MKDKTEWTPICLYARIIELCEAKGWSINTLCVEAQVSPSTLYAMRSRKTFPSIETLNSLCQALGITLSYFFQIKEDVTFYGLYEGLDISCKVLLLELAKRLH